MRLDLAWILRVRLGIRRPVVGNEIEAMADVPSERPRGSVHARVE
jgi:hypothetical protein